MNIRQHFIYQASTHRAPHVHALCNVREARGMNVDVGSCTGDSQTITVGTSFGCAGQPATAWQSEAAATDPREP